MPLERISQGFKDISMTFQNNPLNSDLIVLKNETAIARSIRNIVFTLPGEKFFNPNFGSRVSRSLFENVDEISASIINDEITKNVTLRFYIFFNNFKFFTTIIVNHFDHNGRSGVKQRWWKKSFSRRYYPCVCYCP